MIILDTNVVSEPMKHESNAAVMNWLDQQDFETLYLTATSLAELVSGIAILPDGKRKEGLHEALSRFIDRRFSGRILPFDEAAARLYALLICRARSGGKAISLADGQIAAIAASHKFIVATRDTLPFEAVGVPVINPWLTGTS